MASLNAKGPDQTPLQKKLDIIAGDVGKIGMFAGLLIFHCLVLRSFIEGLMYRNYHLYD
jgi:hypothetical protein